MNKINGKTLKASKRANNTFGMEFYVFKLLVLFTCLLLSSTSNVTAEVHTLQYFYTATSGISNIPKFISVGILDGVEMSYYDSNLRRSVPKQTWMEQLDQQYWDSETKLSNMYDQVFKKDFIILGNRFNHTGGVRVLQKRYGCEWDDDTGATHGHEMFGYDGEDYLILDLKNKNWKASVPKAGTSKRKLESEIASFQYRKMYFNQICVEWMKKYINFGSSTLGRKVPPEVSLFQKDSSSSVVCHATGFYPERVMITWKKGGEEMQEHVDMGETMPNDDGTFQKRAVLSVPPEERKKSQYTCEVAHESGEPIVKTLIVEDGNILGILIGCVASLLALVIIGVIVGIVMMKKKGTELKMESTILKTTRGNRASSLTASPSEKAGSYL